MMKQQSMADEIRELLIEGRMTDAGISDWLGCTRGYVSQVRTLMKMKARRKDMGFTNRQKRQAVENLVRQGVRNKDIAEQIGCHIDLPAKVRRELSK